MNGDQFNQAIRIAAQRGLLPTALGSAELQGLFTGSERRRVLALARVTQASFLSEMKALVTAGVGEELGFSDAQRIAVAKAALQRLGYDPEKGFPGDEGLGIPAAERGSLQDLSSWKRLDLIFKTEDALAHGAAQNLNGNTPIARALYPAWELMRYETRDQPRGSIESGSPGWAVRWVKFGGPALVDDGGRLRMIAGKDDPIWNALGDQAMYEANGFNDLALGTSYPPFAINSGYNVRAVPAAEVKRLGITLRGGAGLTDEERVTLPEVKAEGKKLDPQVRAAMQARLAEIRKLKEELAA